MRLGTDVLAFEAFGIPLLGNAANGSIMGLTAEAAVLCSRMAQEDVPEAEVDAVDAHLAEALRRGGFLGSQRLGCALESAYLHVTQACNLDCVGCYSSDEQRNRADDLPFERLCAIMDELAAAGARHLVVSGGEPFLRADLPAILRHGREACGFQAIDVLTNGTCLTPEKLAAVAPYVDRVSVSFDGAAPDAQPHIRRRQLFDQLVSAVAMVQEAGIAAHIIPTIHGRNIDDVPAYCDLAARLGATMNFSLLSAPVGCAEARGLLPSDDALRKLASFTVGTAEHPAVAVADTPTGNGLRASVGCGARCGGVSVGYDGRAYPCHMLHDDSLCLGELGVRSSAGAGVRAGADQGPLAADALRRIHVDEVEGCSDCELKYLCGGGCRARAFFATGSIYGKDPYCAFMQEHFSLVFQRLARG